jgi:hypothetical protein
MYGKYLTDWKVESLVDAIHPPDRAVGDPVPSTHGSAPEEAGYVEIRRLPEVNGSE